MAFFYDGTFSYMSLSLNPTADKKVYVFQITARQFFVASKMLPFCLGISAVTLFLIAVVGIFGKLNLTSGWLNESQQTEIVLLLAAISTVVAFSEVGFFLGSLQSVFASQRR